MSKEVNTINNNIENGKAKITEILGKETLFTLQDNKSQSYMRVCFVDTFYKDNYKIFKDFALYPNKNCVKISVADSTLKNPCFFKETHKQIAGKTSPLEFSVSYEDLKETVYNICAQKFLVLCGYDDVTRKIPKAKTETTKATKDNKRTKATKEEKKQNA